MRTVPLCIICIAVVAVTCTPFEPTAGVNGAFDMRGEWSLADSADQGTAQTGDLEISTVSGNAFSGSATIFTVGSSGAVTRTVGEVTGSLGQTGNFAFLVKLSTDTIRHMGARFGDSASGTWSDTHGNLGAFVLALVGTKEDSGQGKQSARPRTLRPIDP